MTWNATFPLITTQINQSVTQIQNNWAFLATNIGTEHYFNSGTANEGYSQFDMFIQQGGNVAPAGVTANQSVALFNKANNAAQPKLWCNTTTGGVRQMQTTITTQKGPFASAVASTLIDFTGTEQLQNGLVIVSNDSSRNLVYVGYIIYNGSITTVQIINTTLDTFSISGNLFQVTPFVNNSSYFVSLLRMEL